MLKTTWLLLLAGCWTGKDVESPPTKDGVSVELAAVTLAEDCGDAGTLPPPRVRMASSAAERALPATPAAKEPARRAPAESMAAPADCAEPGCGYQYACDPTSMQLSLRSTGTEPTTLTIKKVELLDAKGKVLSVLTARTPSMWSGETYVAWDQHIAPNTTLSTSYRLSAPQWHQFLEGGRYQAHEKTYQLRVTVGIGTAERTVEKKAISVAMMEPAVPT